MGAYADSEDPEEILQNVALYQSLHCLLRDTEVYLNSLPTSGICSNLCKQTGPRSGPTKCRA